MATLWKECYRTFKRLSSPPAKKCWASMLGSSDPYLGCVSCVNCVNFESYGIARKNDRMAVVCVCKYMILLLFIFKEIEEEEIVSIVSGFWE